MEFVEFAGKGADRPLSYSAIERTFFAISSIRRLWKRR